jgi:hypothetical protein
VCYFLHPLLNLPSRLPAAHPDGLLPRAPLHVPAPRRHAAGPSLWASSLTSPRSAATFGCCVWPGA